MQSQQKKVKWSRGETADALEERTDTGITNVSVSKMVNVITDIYGNISRRPALKAVKYASSDVTQTTQQLASDKVYAIPFFIGADDYCIIVLADRQASTGTNVTAVWYRIVNDKIVKTGSLGIIPYFLVAPYNYAQYNNYLIIAASNGTRFRVQSSGESVEDFTLNFDIDSNYVGSWYAPNGTKTIKVSNQDISGLEFNEKKEGFKTYICTNSITGESMDYKSIDTGVESALGMEQLRALIPEGSLVKLPNLGAYMRVEGYYQGSHSDDNPQLNTHLFDGDKIVFDALATQGGSVNGYRYVARIDSNTNPVHIGAYRNGVLERTGYSNDGGNAYVWVWQQNNDSGVQYYAWSYTKDNSTLYAYTTTAEIKQGSPLYEVHPNNKMGHFIENDRASSHIVGFNEAGQACTPTGYVLTRDSARDTTSNSVTIGIAYYNASSGTTWSVTQSAPRIFMYGEVLTPIADDQATDTEITVEKGFVSLDEFRTSDFYLDKGAQISSSSYNSLVFEGQRLWIGGLKGGVMQNGMNHHIDYTSLVLGSQIGRYTDFQNNYNKENEPITVDIASKFQENVLYLVNYNGLKILTDASEYAYDRVNGAVQQSQNGSLADCLPLNFKSILLYADKSKRYIRAMQYELQSNIFQSSVINKLTKEDLIWKPISLSSFEDKEHETGSFVFVINESMKVKPEIPRAQIAVCNLSPETQNMIWQRWELPSITATWVETITHTETSYYAWYNDSYGLTYTTVNNPTDGSELRTEVGAPETRFYQNEVSSIIDENTIQVPVSLSPATGTDYYCWSVITRVRASGTSLSEEHENYYTLSTTPSVGDQIYTRRGDDEMIPVNSANLRSRVWDYQNSSITLIPKLYIWMVTDNQNRTHIVYALENTDNTYDSDKCGHLYTIDGEVIDGWTCTSINRALPTPQLVAYNPNVNGGSNMYFEPAGHTSTVEYATEVDAEIAYRTQSIYAYKDTMSPSYSPDYMFTNKAIASVNTQFFNPKPRTANALTNMYGPCAGKITSVSGSQYTFNPTLYGFTSSMASSPVYFNTTSPSVNTEAYYRQGKNNWYVVGKVVSVSGSNVEVKVGSMNVTYTRNSNYDRDAEIYEQTQFTVVRDATADDFTITTPQRVIYRNFIRSSANNITNTTTETIEHEYQSTVVQCSVTLLNKVYFVLQGTDKRVCLAELDYDELLDLRTPIVDNKFSPINSITFVGCTVSVYDDNGYQFDATVNNLGELTPSTSLLQNPYAGFKINAEIESHPMDIGGSTYDTNKRIAKASLTVRDTIAGSLTLNNKTPYTSPDGKVINFYNCSGMKKEVRYNIKNKQGAKFTIESATLNMEYGTLISQ